MKNRLYFLIPISLLFISLFNGLPYGYFQILRWSTCITAIYFALNSLDKFNQPVPAVFFAIAILFNPISPIHLSRPTWTILDVITGVIFLIWTFIFQINIRKR